MATTSAILTIIGILVSGVAAYAAIRSVTLTKRGLEAQQEQLRLQQDQAAMMPDLVCSDVTFLDPASVEEVIDTLEEVAKNKREEERKRVEKEQYQRELAEWEARRRVSKMGSILPPPQDPETSPMRALGYMRNVDPVTAAQRSYRGPKPDAVMLIELRNKGKTAATDITGTISANKKIFELLHFPRLDVDKLSGPDNDDFLTAEISLIPELLPGRKDNFRVAIMFYPPSEDTEFHLKYDFITPAGHAVKGQFDLTVPGTSSEPTNEPREV